MTKSLRAVDLGYEWPEWLPDGATWTRDQDGKVELWLAIPQPSWQHWCASRCKNVPQSLIQQIGLTPPDFGDRPWRRCILVKGHEPKLPPCPPGDGWIEWSGGECPVPPTTDVDVQLRNGEMTIREANGDSLAGDWNWDHDGGDGDIIRYRVHQRRYRPYSDTEMMDLYVSSSQLLRKDQQGGGRVDSWARINGIMHVGISGDSSKWSAEGLRLYWEHVDGGPCGVNEELMNDDQPVYRPYTDQELKQRVYEEHYVCTQDGERGGMISGWRRSAASDEIMVRICGMWYGAATLLAEWQYRDGSPCGVEVSE